MSIKQQISISYIKTELDKIAKYQYGYSNTIKKLRVLETAEPKNISKTKKVSTEIEELFPAVVADDDPDSIFYNFIDVLFAHTNKKNKGSGVFLEQNILNTKKLDAVKTEPLYKFKKDDVNYFYNKNCFVYTVGELLELVAYMEDLSKEVTYNTAQLTYYKNRYCKPHELICECYLLTALTIGSVESNSKRLSKTKDILSAIYTGKLSLATPILAYSRFDYAKSISSCFIYKIEDDLDSIMTGLHKAASISSHGGGIGVCVDSIRATGAKVREMPNVAKGITAWLSMLNAITDVVDQGGQRKATITVACGIHHYDVLEMIHLRRETGASLKSFRHKCVDLYPQIVIHDIYMERVLANEEWFVFDPHELRSYGIDLTECFGEDYKSQYLRAEELANEGKLELFTKYRARYLFKNIIMAQIETGFPYIYFKDKANVNNITDDKINYCGNLCMESFTPIDTNLTHVCNLISVNVLKTENEWVKFSRLGCNILNNLIYIFNSTLTSEARTHNDFVKAIGIGVMGLSDLLAKNNKSYKQNDTLDYVENIIEDIAYGAIKESNLYARNYPIRKFKDYNVSSWSKGYIMGKPLDWFLSNSYQPSRWVSLRDAIKQYGITNGYLLSIAPNTSTANVIGVSPSWKPRLNLELQYKSLVGTTPIKPPIDKEYWNNYDLDIVLDQEFKIKLLSRMQKWVDQGISFEMVVNLEPQVYDKPVPTKLYDWIVSSWKHGLKSIYYITSKVPSTDNLDASCPVDCVSCSG